VTPPSTARDLTADVSVLMTVRDGARYLGEALDSILGQREPPGEVVVVDDGSTDDTPQVLDAYRDRCRVLRQEPAGTAAGLNRAVAASTGGVLAFLDADDVWPPDSLAVRLDRLAGDDRPDLVWGRVEQFVSPDVPDDRRRSLHFDPTPSGAQQIGTLLVRRAAFDHVGPFDESLPSASSIDWISRARAVGLRAASVDDVVVRRRLHQTNMGRTLPSAVTLQALRDVVRAHHHRTKGTS
jgi:glycosyltransferase involved in cell wall biosynthesis